MSILDRFRLDGEVAVITGGRTGLGRGMALAFADAGADIAIVQRSPGDKENVCQDIEARGRRALYITADLTAEDGPSRIIEQTLSTFGKLSILVNNAGGMGSETTVKPTMELSDSAWNMIVDLNLTTVFRMSKAAVAAMPDKGGVILNTTSVRATHPVGASAAYSAAKAGVITLTREMALTLAPRIRINAIAPGPVPTEVFRRVTGDDPEVVERYRKSWNLPMQRLGTPEDIATAALFLVSPASSWMTGQTLVVSGGII